MAYLPGSLSTNHPPLTWRAVLHSQRAMLVSDHADAQQYDFASVFFHEAAPLPGDHKAFFPHNEAGTEVVKQKCAWHTTEVVSKKDYIHLWMGGNCGGPEGEQEATHYFIQAGRVRHQEVAEPQPHE